MDERLLTSKEKFSRIVLRIRDHSPFLPWPAKVALVVQVMHESSQGGRYAASDLAAKHLNFTGIKWREEMKEYATKVLIKVPSEKKAVEFCNFQTIDKFIEGYWAFVNRKPYPEVFKYAAINDVEYLRYLWWEGYAADPLYLKKIEDKGYREKALAWLGRKRKLDIYSPRESDGAVFLPKQPSSENPVVVTPKPDKPPVVGKDPSDWNLPDYEWIPSTKRSSRAGAKITEIILHYTYSKTWGSALHTLTKGTRVASAHWLIGRDGRIAQLVKLEEKAWHAGNANPYSIGIEHVAWLGEALTPDQEKATVALIGWHLKKYGLGYAAISGHRYSGTATTCPANLFGPNNTAAELKAWRKKHFGKHFKAGPREAIRG